MASRRSKQAITSAILSFLIFSIHTYMSVTVVCCVCPDLAVKIPNTFVNIVVNHYEHSSK